ncbi:MAG: alpha-2-macroglobulin family protein [Candidatus Gracilibacteria bacterium]|nr:alpha-2-macroglobulin family protein [Candidatus Gracilibacteria bacterium]
MLKKFKLKVSKKYILALFISIIIFLVGYSITPVLNYFAKKQVKEILSIISDPSSEKSFEDCKTVLNFDKSKISKNNMFFNEMFFDEIYKKCSQKYDLKNLELNLDNCKIVIKETNNYFKNNYVFYDSLDTKREECNKKYLNPKFSIGTFFNINNDFKTSIVIDFELEFFTDIGEENSVEYLKNRNDAKARLVKLLEIEPKMDIALEDVYLYKNKAILNLALEPLKDYKIRLIPFDTSIGEKTKNSEFSFKTPENKYFGMKIVEPLSIYTKNNLPKFQVLDYNTSKTQTKIKICRVPEETYGKIEVLSSSDNKTVNDDFFKNSVSTLKTFECIEKNIIFKEEADINKNLLIKKDFSFSDFINENDPKGLYVVYFSDSLDREYNSRVNKPLFFGIVNSHITMKTSRNGEGFFFVNDFDGNPLGGQKIEAYLNDFAEIEKIYNDTKNDFDVKYNSVIDKDIFSKKIYLGETGPDGILKVNLKDLVSDYFIRTFEDNWEYDWTKTYKSFLVNANSTANQSYLVSTWNSGIAPWNFGYTTNYYSYDSNSINLDRWGETPDYFTHIYTDRKLYLPTEVVNIKLILRKSLDLSIPKSDEDFDLKILNTKGEEVLSKKINVNEFGSYNDTLNLRSDFPLGTYTIFLNKGDKTISYSSFDVEVFKNPKFKNDISLTTSGLNNDYVDIKETKVQKYDYYTSEDYIGKFSISGNVTSSYFSGPRVKNANFTYKVYKQYYYEDDYWDACYYGCYWEPNKEFYTEGTGTLDSSGMGKFNVDIDFSSNYSDYKYIVEVSVTDEAGDTITGSNSVIAKLPNDYKKYNNESSLEFTSSDKFLKVGGYIDITGKLNVGKWTKDYNDKYIFIVKRKEYTSKKIKDVNGFDRNIETINEIVDRVFYVNDKNFTLNSDGNLELSYKLDKNAEYIFEYGMVKNYSVGEYLGLNADEKIEKSSLDEIVKKFNDEKTLYIENYVEQVAECSDNEKCPPLDENKITKRLYLREFITSKYFPVITYENSNASNPIENDNKLRVISEKSSYKLGETAKVLIRLPVSNSKILWTIEKNGVVSSEYIDVVGNVFFKEFVVDDTFIPNAYIGVMMVDTTKNKIPEYKVGYTEVVVDKTDKKSFIDIKTDKQTYKPREKVNLDLEVKDGLDDAVKSELTVMVVDDSLISLMGNVDLNTLEKIFVKLPFSIQTSITNIAMLKNYYFSRLGIVGGSGFGDFKGGDSAVSTRNIFKNTAYYNPSVITDEDGKAKVSFDLPDNLTNFRVMVISNSVDNFFGYSEKFIEVRKNVTIEDKTPLILRDNDKSTISANVFNNSKEDIDFKVILTTKGVEVTNPEKLLTLKAGTSKNVSWNIIANSSVDIIDYTISALGNTADNSDKIENKITIKDSPILITQTLKSGTMESYSSLNLQSIIGKNTSLENSKVELIFSNSRLSGIEKIVSSLAIYPYGCIEQTTSSTIPNVIIKQFSNLFKDIFDLENVDKNIKAGVDRISSMQTADGGFAYWQGNSSSDLHITPYVLRSLIYMKNSGIEVDAKIIENATAYLEKNYETSSDEDEKSEIYWALKYAGKKPGLTLKTKDLDRHALLAYTYGLFYSQNKDLKIIKSNIELIKTKINSDSSSWYWDKLSDKAIFASLLLDLNDETYNSYIETLIADLYTYDWSSYYYSTQSKNNAFIAFYKYLEKNKLNNKAKFSFKLGNFSDNKKYDLGGDNLSLIKLEYNLKNISEGDLLNLSVGNNSESKIYVDFILKEYPIDKLKIPASSNGMSIKREIFEVKNESLLDKCSNEYYYYEEHKIDCDSVLVKVTTNVFDKTKLYKTKVTVSFPDEKVRRNLTIEDYLPGSFRVINSKFKTESSSVTSVSNNWSWDYSEIKSDVIMANASYVWGKTAVFEYYFRPEFAGTYTYPPVTGYLMYDPTFRANSIFSLIEVK